MASLCIAQACFRCPGSGTRYCLYDPLADTQDYISGNRPLCLPSCKISTTHNNTSHAIPRPFCIPLSMQPSINPGSGNPPFVSIYIAPGLHLLARLGPFCINTTFPCRSLSFNSTSPVLVPLYYSASVLRRIALLVVIVASPFLPSCRSLRHVTHAVLVRPALTFICGLIRAIHFTPYTYSLSFSFSQPSICLKSLPLLVSGCQHTLAVHPCQSFSSSPSAPRAMRISTLSERHQNPSLTALSRLTPSLSIY